MYVDGQKPAAIAKAHGISVDQVLDYAARLGVTDDLLRAGGLGSGTKSRETLRLEALDQREAA